MASHDVSSRRSSLEANEKANETHSEKHSAIKPNPELVPTIVDRDAGLDPAAVRRAILRLDLVVLPVVGASTRQGRHGFSLTWRQSVSTS